MATPINRSQMAIGERYPNFIAITISQLLKISTPNRVYWYVSRPLSLITLVQSPNGILAGVWKTLLIMLDKVMILWKGCGFKEGASILFTAVILIRGRGNDAHYDPDPTGMMTESDESNTIMCLPHVMRWHAAELMWWPAIKWFVKISLDHKSSAKSHPHSEASGQKQKPLTWFDKQFLQRFSFLRLMILVMVKCSFNYCTIENIWYFKAHKTKTLSRSYLHSPLFSLYPPPLTAK